MKKLNGFRRIGSVPTSDCCGRVLEEKNCSKEERSENLYLRFYDCSVLLGSLDR